MKILKISVKSLLLFIAAIQCLHCHALSLSIHRDEPYTKKLLSNSEMVGWKVIHFKAHGNRSTGQKSSSAAASPQQLPPGWKQTDLPRGGYKAVQSPRRMKNVTHDKEAGGGYKEGSPLYEKQMDHLDKEGSPLHDEPPVEDESHLSQIKVGGKALSNHTGLLSVVGVLFFLLPLCVAIAWLRPKHDAEGENGSKDAPFYKMKDNVGTRFEEDKRNLKERAREMFHGKSEPSRPDLPTVEAQPRVITSDVQSRIIRTDSPLQTATDAQPVPVMAPRVVVDSTAPTVAVVVDAPPPLAPMQQPLMDFTWAPAPNTTAPIVTDFTLPSDATQSRRSLSPMGTGTLPISPMGTTTLSPVGTASYPVGTTGYPSIARTLQ